MSDIATAVDEMSANPAEIQHDAAQLVRYYMTSDLRAATGISRTHLDFYLREGLVVPTARTESGYLLFDDAELARLREVISARQQGRPLRDIKETLHR